MCGNWCGNLYLPKRITKESEVADTGGSTATAAAAGACQDDCVELLVEGNHLLAACDRLVESEEEILELNNLSAQTYVSAHKQCDLVWQKYFHDKS